MGYAEEYQKKLVSADEAVRRYIRATGSITAGATGLQTHWTKRLQSVRTN